jgi:predicted RNase H-like nuclease (RuvC/YqgF family)
MRNAEGGAMMKRLMLLTVAAVALMGSSARRDAYIISTGDDNTFSISSSIDELKSVRTRMNGRYVWVRRDGHEYVIRDEKTIDRVETLFEPSHALAPEQEAISRAEEKLDHEADRLSDKSRLTLDERTRLRELHEQLRDVARREQELDARQEELERVAERAFWAEVDAAIRAGTAKPLNR